MYNLPKLKFEKNALKDFLTEEQMSFHYDKHHKAYIDNLNGFMEKDPSLKSKTLEEIVKTSSGGIFNNAAQIWNHTFYWFCMTAEKKAVPDTLKKAIEKDFGSFEDFKTKFVEGGMGTFGSGWIWLCKDASGKLSLVSTSNAAVPFTNGQIPLLVADVWEHAYYVDYRNLRKKYLETFLNYVDWNFVAENLAAAGTRELTSTMKS